MIIDKIIKNLLQTNVDSSNHYKMDEITIQWLCQTSRAIFLTQPMLLELEVPIKVCGDIHGQYPDLLKIFKICGSPPFTNYLFLGDYVDRGKNSIETICLLMAFKIKYPENFFILRGNHESSSINKVYGFYDECKRRYSPKLFRIFNDAFNCLPVSAVICDKIFCCHGGISPHLKDLDQIRRLIRPCHVGDENSDNKSNLLIDLLWSDPQASTDKHTKGKWLPNDRGISFLFDEVLLKEFLERFEFDIVFRAHQVVDDGYEFFAGRKLVTVFSAPRYCGEFDNKGGVISVDENLLCSFHIIS